MKDNDNVLDEFRDSIGRLKGHFHILEQPVPIEEQIHYFKYSDKLRGDKNKLDLSNMSPSHILEMLNDDEIDETQKKSILSTLAISQDIQNYRVLEEYAKNPSPEVYNWTLLALMESRITLETELSEEKQIFISSGLGGKSEKMRFYILILSKRAIDFEPYQKSVVHDEGTYVLEKANCEIERMNFGDKYIELVVLMPIGADVKEIVSKVIDSCNEFGNFISDSFTLTNVKIFKKTEIENIIRKHERDLQASN